MMQPIPSRLRNALHATLFFSFFLFIFNSCTKHDHNPPGNGGGTAQGTLQAEGGSCLPGTVHGTWYAGVQPGVDSNYVEISVNVTKTGTYSITTDSVNGVKFSGSGLFISTGLQLVRLKPTGRFNSVGSANFTTSFSNTSCGFSVNAQLPLITNNTWRAVIGGRQYWGTAHAVVTYYTGDESWDFVGTVSGAPDTTVVMRFRMPLVWQGENVQFGTYRSSYVGARFLLQAAGVTYLHAEGPGPGVMVMTIKGVENTVPATHYEGTFSGTVKDSSGNLTEIKDGVYMVGP